MILIAYILIALASLAMVYFGHAQGTSQFYMSVFSAAIIWYCIYLDYKNRRSKKEAEQNKSAGNRKNTNISSSKSKKGGSTANIGKIARKSTKDKDLKK
ncbi:MAG: hypothetical protein ACI4BB_13655 [Coprococcus sp.]